MGALSSQHSPRAATNMAPPTSPCSSRVGRWFATLSEALTLGLHDATRCSGVAGGAEKFREFLPGSGMKTTPGAPTPRHGRQLSSAHLQHHCRLTLEGAYASVARPAPLPESLPQNDCTGGRRHDAPQTGAASQRAREAIRKICAHAQRRQGLKTGGA